jgi:DNA-binding transcriptional MerR regulator
MKLPSASTYRSRIVNEVSSSVAVPKCMAAGEPTPTERLHLLTEHDAQVRERIAVLQAQREHLQEKIGWYRGQLSANGGS